MLRKFLHGLFESSSWSTISGFLQFFTNCIFSFIKNAKFSYEIHVNACTKFKIHNYYIYFYQKKRPTHSPKKPVQINEHAHLSKAMIYKITLIRRGKNPFSPCWELNGPYLDALCQIGLEVALWFWRRRWLNLVYVFLLFHNYHSSKMGGGAFIGTKLNPLHQKKMLCNKVWLKMVQWIFKFCQCIFTIS